MKHIITFILFLTGIMAGAYAQIKPSLVQIAEDLYGRTINEGTDDGYHDSEWTYTIERGNISFLRAEKVYQNDANAYVLDVSMRLTKGGNYYYQTLLRVDYRLSNNRFALHHVTSLGMRPVSDGRYDSSVSGRLVDDGWGGVNCLELRNRSDIPLIVAGKFKAKDTWHKFSTQVPPNGRANVGGTFSGGSVTSYKIEYVVSVE